MKTRNMFYFVLVALFVFAGNSFAKEEAEELFEIIGPNATEGLNTFFGSDAGINTTGLFNSFFGFAAGKFNTTGEMNSYFGTGAGNSNTTGSGNVCIGWGAGSNETGSNKLYIDNSSTSSPLVYGDFDNRSLQLNGSVAIESTNSSVPLLVQTSATGHLATFFRKDGNTAEIQIGQSTAVNKAAVIGFSQDGAYYYMSVYGLGSNRLVFNSSGYLGIGTTTPSYPLEMSSGAYVTTGGVWTNASSREYKTDIKQLTAEKAMDALTQLKPVEFAYKADSEDRHVGFIAEDAPDLVASKDRKGMSSMDVVAVLTKVVQEQQKTITELSEKVAQLQVGRR